MKQIQVLLIDDEQDQILLAQTHLSTIDPTLNIETATSADAALKLLKIRSFDCIVSDYIMPKTNGLDLYEKLRREGVTTPFILYTGQGSEEIAEKAFAMAVDDYVRKEQSLAHYNILARRIRHSVDRSRITNALKISEDRYRQLFDSMSECYQLLDLIYDESGKAVDYTYIDVNPAFERLTGKTMKEFVGKKAKELFRVVEDYWIEAYDKAVKTGERIRFENYGAELDKWYDIEAWRTGEGKCAVIFTDITERKKAEIDARQLAASIQYEKDRLSALVNSIQDEVWFADTEKRFTLANPSALKEFGLASTEQGIDVEKFASSLEVYRSDGSIRPVEEAPPLRALKGEVIRNEVEIIRLPKSGELRYREVSAAPMRNTNNEVIGSVSVVRDITDRKKSEKELQESNEELIATENELRAANARVQEYAGQLERTVEERTRDINEAREKVIPVLHQKSHRSEPRPSSHDQR